VKLISLRVFLTAGLLVFQTSAHDAIRASHGMVVSAHRLASQAGVDVLKSGGNAIDAAVATGLALAVTHPAAGNIGGGGFMVIALRDGRVTTVDFRETAPAAARVGMYLGPDGHLLKNANHEGFRAVGIPGTVAGFDFALKKYGTRSWRDLTPPAISLARNGFPLSTTMAGDFAQLRADWLRNPAAAAVFLQRDGSPYRTGQIWKQPDLARTLERIQRHGHDGFYRGPTARRLAAAMKRRGGLITEVDLATYQARERVPIRGLYHGWEVISMPPPSSGGTALVEMLNMLERHDLGALGHNSPAYLHLLTETMRRAFADRARFLGDPEANPNLANTVTRLISKEHAARLDRGIAVDRASASDPVRMNEAYESPETTHYSVIDSAGNAVVVTYTLEYAYGSRLVADGLGFLLNNEMGDFNPQPDRTDASGLIGTSPNLVRPGRRMLSSMTPTILRREGQPRLLVGSPGGRTIINTVLQVILNTIDFSMDPVAAIAAPRVHHQWLPNELMLEATAGGQSGPVAWPLTELRNLGHRVRVGGTQGSVMAITVDPVTGEYVGVADPRQADAAAVGY